MVYFPRSTSKGLVSTFLSKVLNSWSIRSRDRNKYNEGTLQGFSENEIRRLRKRYFHQLFFFISLFIGGIFIFIFTVYLGNSRNSQSGFLGDTGSYLSSSSTILEGYRTEQVSLTAKLNSLYGTDYWEFGIYQTELDAYRVLVTLSDGTIVEKYYRVSPDGRDISEVVLEN